VPEFGDGLFHVALFERSLAFGDVQIGILVPAVSGGEFSTFFALQLPPRLCVPPAPRPAPNLIVGFTALRL